MPRNLSARLLVTLELGQLEIPTVLDLNMATKPKATDSRNRTPAVSRRPWAGPCASPSPHVAGHARLDLGVPAKPEYL